MKSMIYWFCGSRKVSSFLFQPIVQGWYEAELGIGPEISLHPLLQALLQLGSHLWV